MNTRKNEKASEERQWQERSDAPIATRPMTPADIIDFREKLVASYKCEPSEIDYFCEKIKDTNDTDRDDCLWLIYTLQCVVAGKPTKREIFRLKIPIPDKVRQSTENLRREQIRRRAKPLQLQ
jgi:hypothetical protein